MAAGITATSFLAGNQLSLSHVSMATISDVETKAMMSEETRLDQFKVIFQRGMHLCPTSAIFAALCYFGNAGITAYYTKGPLWPLPGRVAKLLLPGVLAVGIMPYTIALIVPLEEKLLRKETLGKPGQTEAGLRKWNRLNYARSLIPFLSLAAGWCLWLL
ncbi:hypothetical protein McanCB49686_001698 [Microsporum canis]